MTRTDEHSQRRRTNERGCYSIEHKMWMSKLHSSPVLFFLPMPHWRRLQFQPHRRTHSQCRATRWCFCLETHIVRRTDIKSIDASAIHVQQNGRREWALCTCSVAIARSSTPLICFFMFNLSVACVAIFSWMNGNSQGTLLHVARCAGETPRKIYQYSINIDRWRDDAMADGKWLSFNLIYHFAEKLFGKFNGCIFGGRPLEKMAEIFFIDSFQSIGSAQI